MTHFVVPLDALGRDDVGIVGGKSASLGAVPADQFIERFDGFSIGSNESTHLVLEVDRDSSQLAQVSDERSPAVLAAIEQVIAAGKQTGREIGICGQGPIDHPDLAESLVRNGIDSIAVSPDALVKTRQLVAAIEAELGRVR